MNVRLTASAGSAAMPAASFTLAVCTLAFAALANASPCYVVLDRSDNVIYQSVQPPVDLSAQGASAREAMRRRGEFMEAFDSNHCVERSARSKSGKGEASVDEIVATLKPYQRVGRVGAMSSPDDDAGQFANSQ